MVLILVTTALAEIRTFDAAVSAGWLHLVSLDDDIASDGNVRRADLGVGFGVLHVGAFASWSTHSAGYLYDYESPIVGDFYLTRLGLSGRWAPPIGRFLPGLRVEAGTITFLQPFDETAWNEDIAPYLGENDRLGMTSTGLLVGLGADTGFALVPDHVWVNLSVDAGFDTLPTLGFEVGVRAGLSASL